MQRGEYKVRKKLLFVRILCTPQSSRGVAVAVTTIAIKFLFTVEDDFERERERVR